MHDRCDIGAYPAGAPRKPPSRAARGLPISVRALPRRRRRSSGARLTPAEWDVALSVCTQRQLVVMGYRRKGVGWRRIATITGLSVGTVRDHAEAGNRNLERALSDSPVTVPAA